MNLNQVTVGSVDVAASVDFYKKLGLKLIVDSVPRYARFELPDGDSTFSIHTTKENLPSNTIIYFECDDLDARVEELKSKGIEFLQEPIDQVWLWREAYLIDPGGNKICLFYAGENRKDPPWRIG